MIEITQQRNKCIGCNACVEASYSRWRMSRKDGKSILMDGVKKRNVYSVIVGNDEYKENRKAANNCPVRIIRLKQL
ncbi:MAG TPA: ferredoxin [Bacteroidia bacterium]|jgi:ferredoxin|nr:ferredoxin [Bacteroidia bacterium]